MSAATTHGSTLRALVLFMVCLSIVGTLVAGTHWFMIDKPHQDAIQSTAPANGGIQDCPACIASCPSSMPYNDCLARCEKQGFCGFFIE